MTLNGNMHSISKYMHLLQPNVKIRTQTDSYYQQQDIATIYLLHHLAETV